MQFDQRILTRSTDVTSASDRFKGYEPIIHQDVRLAQVQGDELSRLRQKLKLLREMPPDVARRAIDFRREELDLFGALDLAKKLGKVLVPNDIVDRVLTETDAKIHWHRTGTMVIYEAPGMSFGEKFTYDSISFTVPEQFRGKKDCVLVVECPDFNILPSGNKKHELIVDDPTRIHLLERFPGKSGWNLPDDKFKVPVGEPVQESDEARYLWRHDASYIGPLVRLVDGIYYRRDVFAYVRHASAFGVALF